MKRIIFVILLLSLHCVFAQKKEEKKGLFAKQPPTNELSWEKKLEFADKLFGEGDYYSAIRYYNECLSEKLNHAHCLANLAESYYLSFDYANAMPQYKKLVDENSAEYPAAKFNYAMCLKLNCKYAEAKTVFKDFITNYSGDEAAVYNKKTVREMEGCDFAMKAMADTIKYIVINVGDVINSSYNEMAPVPTNDSGIVFSAIPSDTIIHDFNNSEDYYTKLYKSRLSDTGWSQPMAIENLNVKKEMNANGAYSLDKKKFYFSRYSKDKDAKATSIIYVSEIKENDEFRGGDKLPAPINKCDCEECDCIFTQPAIGSGPNGEEVLYFVSNRPGGQGGMDIWYSVINKDGSFSNPMNAGKEINTPDDEITPSYHNKSKTLYFSSNGMVSMGTFDIYKSNGSMGVWSKPENMGYPINSCVDDVYFTLEDNDFGDGYFSSNRVGSFTVKNATCCQDIYRLFKIRPPVFAVTGFIFQQGDTTKIPIEGAMIGIAIDTVFASDTSRKDKAYFWNLKGETVYKITVNKPGFLPGSVTVSTVGLRKSDTIVQNVYLEKLVVGVAYTLEDIYYDYDKWNLREESQKSLDNLLFLLNENPTIIVEIGSHTDSKGSDDYNKKLSQRRAESVLKYLTAKGIDKKRLKAKGYGETVPIAPNENPDGTDNPEGRQMNRRTVFKIVGETKGKVTHLQNKPKVVR